jgi:hypothetical protein
MRTRTIPPPTSPRPGSPGRRGRGAVAGLLACGAALGVAELLAGFVGAQASPLVAVGGAAIDATPQWLKEFAIRAFGERDKLVVLAGIAVVLAGFAVAVGLLAVRRLWLGLAGVAVFGAVGAAAALSRPGAGLLDALPSLVGALQRPGSGLRPPVGERTGRGRGASRAVHSLGRDRRGGGGPAADRGRGGPAAVSGHRGACRRGGRCRGGRWAGAGPAVGRDCLAGRGPHPEPGSAAAPLAEGAAIDLPGLSSFYTPNRDFYRVDTALVVPRIAAEDWRLRVHGRVDRDLDLDFRRLLARPLIERDITLSCVSNEVAGRYVGTARWVGVPLRELLEEAGCNPGPTSSSPARPTGSPSAPRPPPCSTGSTPCWPWP